VGLERVDRSCDMALVKRERAASTHLDPVERLFGDLPTWMRWPARGWPTTEDFVRVDEYREDSTLVVRAEMAGIDPDKDVEVTVSDDVLHISAERREEKKDEGKDYYRRELRYGSFSRDLPLPQGVKESDVKASYKDGILEIRVSLPKVELEKAPAKVPVTKVI